MKKINVYNLTKKKFLITREEAQKIKTLIKNFINDGIELDFENVEVISPTWTSEAIGEIIYDYEKEIVQKKIVIKNANDHIKNIINFTANQIIKLKNRGGSKL